MTGRPAPARPRVHVTPGRGWLNDPNGPVLLDGRHHVFFQHQPDSLEWGPMHWGHAVSDDLLHWKARPIAMKPDSDGVVYSGSIVQDGDGPLLAYYTRVSPDGVEAQCLATSDDGDEWHRHHASPLLVPPEGVTDFRDPKVLRYGDSHWVMVLAVGEEVWFYRSDDLLTWVFTSRFGRGYGAHDGVWETPDLIDLGDTWVLSVSVISGGPVGGSGTQYFAGTFDGDTFTTEDTGVHWVDLGPDFYAPQSWWGVEDSTWLGWMSNWSYAARVPADTWRGVLSLPRTLTWDEGLVQTPAPPFAGSRAGTDRLELVAGRLRVEGDRYELDVRGTRLVVADGLLTLDRTATGPEGGAPVAQAAVRGGALEVVVDTCTVEVFADGGRVALSALVYPDLDQHELRITGDVDTLEVEHYD
ncbi:MAG TPA: glycoside hydrolase family 32 protein [Nocardioidaceae bacterium]|nr:glycoside hydrolase family 32 protein [Nocardioidaceae bacterium]